MSNALLAYHFLRENMKAGRGYESPWAVGESRSVAGEIIPCERGYHGSPTLWDALPYAPGPVACLVELSGDVSPHGNPINKYAARTRKLLAAVNIETELRLFAADCAERVLSLYETEYPDDDRPRRAIEAARAFARGEIDSPARGAAAWAAWDAARGTAAWAALDAARGTARAAAWAARAARTALDAARTVSDARTALDAAWTALDAARTASDARTARDAVWTAWDARTARAAAWDARTALDAARTAWDADRGAAAWAAERAWQQEQFETRVAHLFDWEDMDA